MTEYAFRARYQYTLAVSLSFKSLSSIRMHCVSAELSGAVGQVAVYTRSSHLSPFWHDNSELGVCTVQESIRMLSPSNSPSSARSTLLRCTARCEDLGTCSAECFGLRPYIWCSRSWSMASMRSHPLSAAALLRCTFVCSPSARRLLRVGPACSATCRVSISKVANLGGSGNSRGRDGVCLARDLEREKLES